MEASFSLSVVIGVEFSENSHSFPFTQAEDWGLLVTGPCEWEVPALSMLLNLKSSSEAEMKTHMMGIRNIYLQYWAFASGTIHGLKQSS